MGEIEDLRSRVAELERENAQLADEAHSNATTLDSTQPRSRGRGRKVASAVLIVVGVLLAPIAVVGSWAHSQLVDTESFTETFSPLADEPAIQAFIAEQVATAVTEQIDTDQLVGTLFDGIRSLGLPDAANDALTFVEGPASVGVNSMINSAVEAVVTSEEFSTVWESSLRLTHGNAIAVIQGNSDSALELADDGTLSLQLGILTTEVKNVMDGQFFGLVDMIPVIDQSIPLLQSDALAMVRIVYYIAVTIGFWLPWATLVLLVGGVLLARRKLRAVMGTAVALTAVLALFAIVIAVGRVFFVSGISPSVMPSATAHALYDHLTSSLLSVSIALAVLGGLIAVMSWFAGTSRTARSLRSLTERISESARNGAERHGVTTGKVGVFVERWHSPILILVAVLGGLIIFLNRPVTTGGVIGTIVGVLVVFIVVELVRRPNKVASVTDEATVQSSR